MGPKYDHAEGGDASLSQALYQSPAQLPSFTAGNRGKVQRESHTKETVSPYLGHAEPAHVENAPGLAGDNQGGTAAS